MEEDEDVEGHYTRFYTAPVIEAYVVSRSVLYDVHLVSRTTCVPLKAGATHRGVVFFCVMVLG